MIRIGTDIYDFNGKNIVANGVKVQPAMASYLITGFACVGGAGIFSKTESATMMMGGVPRKINFGEPVDYTKLDEAGISELIERRIYSIRKDQAMEHVKVVDFHGHKLTIYRHGINIANAATLSKELTGAEFTDGMGIFASDRVITFEAGEATKDFEFGLISLAMYTEDEVIALLNTRIGTVKEWVTEVTMNSPADDHDVLVLVGFL